MRNRDYVSSGYSGASIRSAGSFVYAPGGTPYTAGSINKNIIAYQGNDAGSAVNGNLLADGTPSSIPTVTMLRVGAARVTNYLNGWDRQIWYQPVRDVDNSLSDYSR